ncbi:MAG: hypothetical protein EOM87_09815 [Clostridia bacterium]|nr:hypothetical protein [Clostridia bacterium]
MVVGFFCSANRINLFHCKEVMAISAELLDCLVGMADDFAADLDVVKQYRAEAIAQLAALMCYK